MTKNNDQKAKATADCAPMTCSASRCEWWTGNKKQGFETCPNQADWQWPTPRGKTWMLCDYHKRLVLESYNAATRKKEGPEWTRIVTPNKIAEPSPASDARKTD